MSRYKHNIITPSGCCNSSFITAKTPGTHQKDFLQEGRVLLFLVEFNILIFP